MEHNQSKTPLDNFKHNFRPLYRGLLILGLLSILFSLASISNISTLFSYLSSDIFYALSGLISLLVVLPLMISSLILLWHKHPTGIILRLSGYAVSIAAAVLGLFSAPNTIKDVVDSVYQANPQVAELSTDLAASIAESSFYGAFYLSIVISLLLSHLWWRAWTKQLKSDNKKSKKDAS